MVPAKKSSKPGGGGEQGEGTVIILPPKRGLENRMSTLVNTFQPSQLQEMWILGAEGNLGFTVKKLGSLNIIT